MSLNYETAASLVERGEFGELRKLAEPYLADSKCMEPRVLVLAAHALVYTGESRRALVMLRALDVESRSAKFSRARAHLVLGLANRSIGNMTQALTDLQRALRLAQESGTHDEVAWAHLYLFRQMIDGHPVDLAPAMLPVVRAAVTKAGSPAASAFLHICVAVLEGHNGRLNEAARHSEIAQSLVALSQNAWLSCGNQLNRAAILLAGCRFSEALKTLESLREEAARHGLSHEMAQADANLGHLHAMVGNYDRALETLSRVANSPNTPRLAALSACEGMARSYLAQGNLLRCREVLDQIDSVASEDAALARAYAVRWASITRVRLSFELEQPMEALRQLSQLERHYQGIADGPFAAALSVMAVRALALGGRPHEAAVEIARADRRGSTTSRELQSQFYDAAASALPATEEQLASSLRRRANDVRLEQGAAPKSAAASPLQRLSDGTFGTNAGMHSAVNSLSSAIDLAHNPRLLFGELSAAIASMECSPGVRSVVVPSPSIVEQGPGVELLSLGVVDGDSWYLECQLPSSPASALALGDVLRVGRAAVALERLRAAERNQTAVWPADDQARQDGALFLSDEMRDLADTARRVASTDVPVLITGETGTGKEVVAKIIHSTSARSKRPFIPFNCTTVPKEMMDSQLFGHRRGAFTGAIEAFQGVIRGARGGTLFLDEIGDLSLESQPKLLRFLESGEVLPLGESSPSHVDVRVIAATNADLDAAVSSGRFREDLYYRLNIVQLRLPPLRDRRTEIPSLSRFYLQKFAIQFEKGDLRLGDETMEYLVLFKWPGNVRQLANEMRRLAALAERDAVLMPEHLSPEICRSRRTLPATVQLADSNHVVVRLDQPLAAAIQHVERAMLNFHMNRTDGKVEAVAKALGLSRKGLYLKRQRYAGSESTTP